VQVKYSNADLEAAGSDVSKLAIARYDDSDNKWTILPTTLDKNALTLSATTNWFSIWVVMVSGGGNTAGAGPASGKAGPEATLVFAALGLMIVFIGRKIRK
jgi:hypothetical protein